MSSSSCLRRSTLGSDMFSQSVESMMPWTNSLHLRKNRKTNWVNVSKHFNLIEVVITCLISLILSSRSMGLYPN